MAIAILVIAAAISIADDLSRRGQSHRANPGVPAATTANHSTSIEATSNTPVTTSVPYAGDSRYRPMLAASTRRAATRQEAIAWWTVGPALGLSEVRPDQLRVEQFFVSEKDPQDAGTEFTVVYHDGSADLTVDSFRDVLAKRGGVGVKGTHQHFQPPPDEPSMVRAHVHGRPAMVGTSLRSQGAGTDFVIVRWTEPTHAGHVIWMLMADPNHYNERQAIALAETIVELTP